MTTHPVLDGRWWTPVDRAHPDRGGQGRIGLDAIRVARETSSERTIRVLAGVAGTLTPWPRLILNAGILRVVMAWREPLTIRN